MKYILHIMLICLFCINLVYAENFSLDDILEDIYNQLSEEGDIPYENLQESLIEIATYPINLNKTNAEELSKLYFLSDEQIDAILLYQYQHPFQDIYELQLIDCLKDYDIRNLLPFVYIGKPEKEKILFREIFHYANHEITLRIDVRNIENFQNDSIYAKLRYRFNYKNRIQAGVTIGRPTGVPWQKIEYGGYIQLRDIGVMKSIVAGNYQASFGYGLVVGSPYKRGKNSYIQSTAITDEGLKKYSSVSNSYNYFHGIGATTRINWAEISTFYSLQKEKNDIWHHVIGINATGRWNRLKVGITAIENIYSQHNENQVVIGINARYNIGKVDIWSEIATTQGEKWGLGTITGLRYTPITNLNLLTIYRYYSNNFNNIYANSLCSHSKINNEHGGYLGIEYNRFTNWQLSLFGDIWLDGFETMAQADYLPQKDYRIHTRFRLKNKDNKTTYSLRWNIIYDIGLWKTKTQVDGNLVHTYANLTYGWSIFQDIEYRFNTIPIVLQLRAQAFDARQWDNRVYIYENDVLYNFAIPFVYGLGGRFWLNARYKINDIFSIYLRISETIYQKAWAMAHDRKNTRTDIHTLVRIKL